MSDAVEAAAEHVLIRGEDDGAEFAVVLFDGRPAIRINVGGYVIVRPARKWHEAALNESRSENRAYIPPPADANGKRPRLFYWEDAEDCWCPAEGLEVDNIISVGSFFRDGDIEEIRFKREDMTDAEFDAIPEG